MANFVDDEDMTESEGGESDEAIYDRSANSLATERAVIDGSQRSAASTKLPTKYDNDLASDSSVQDSSSESEAGAIDPLDGKRHSERYHRIMKEKRSQGICPMLNNPLQKGKQGFLASAEFMKLKK